MGKKKRIPNVQRKKAWEVVKASKDEFTGLGMDGKYGKKNFRKFGKYGAFVTHDPGEAKYIEEAFGRDGDNSVVVCEVDNAGSQIPRKVFSINAPWKNYEEEEDGNNES